MALEAEEKALLLRAAENTEETKGEVGKIRADVTDIGLKIQQIETTVGFHKEQIDQERDERKHDDEVLQGRIENATAISNADLAKSSGLGGILGFIATALKGAFGGS